MQAVNMSYTFTKTFIPVCILSSEEKKDLNFKDSCYYIRVDKDAYYKEEDQFLQIISITESGDFFEVTIQCSVRNHILLFESKGHDVIYQCRYETRISTL